MSLAPQPQVPQLQVPPVEVNLTAAIVALADDEPLILKAEGRGAHDTALPSGPFNPLAHRTFEIGLREWVREQAGALGIADRLVLPGFLANPYALLARADAFCLSSNAEGFPNALVEAMALGVPVVATNCADGPAEILAGVRREAIGGVHIAPAGILVPPGDADAFAQALRDVGNSELRERLIDGGRRRVADYSVAAAIERYWRVIDALLAGQATAST
jgi:N-acetylgalactosamine-N,N'-diacetylbacillosaminyl-diphospho-undecaprenol 4-alpha-N-acetylgalactosaminyltransferase